MNVSNVSELLERQAVIDVVIRLAGVLDRRTWEGLPELIADDAEGYGAVGLADITARIRQHLGGCGPSQHLLGNHEVSIDGDTAQCVSRVRVLHQGREDATKTLELLGEYTDRLVRSERGWLIAHRHLEVQMQFGDWSVLQPG